MLVAAGGIREDGGCSLCEWSHGLCRNEHGGGCGMRREDDANS